jgi:uncharacterized membrane protein YkoI
MRRFLNRLSVAAAVVLVGLVAVTSLNAEQDKGKSGQDQIPKKVMDSLKAKFPKAKIDKWTKEREADKVVYDIEFKQEDRKFEADIFEDGTIHNWEKQVEAKELPRAAIMAVVKKFPQATIIEIMAVTEVKGREEKLEGYEVVMETAGEKKVEVTVAPDGKILEDSGEPKSGEK